jgi:hypothetical protein
MKLCASCGGSFWAYPSRFKTATQCGKCAHSRWPSLPAQPLVIAAPSPAPVTASNLYAHAKDGTLLRPWNYGGYYVVSRTRFERDYVRVLVDKPLEPYLRDGYSLRMGAPGYPPSLISPGAVRGRR